MNNINIKTLVDWLGPEGAVAGLEKSSLTVSELSELAMLCGLTVKSKMKRGDVIVELVHRNAIRIDKTTDELLRMSSDDLSGYFRSRKVSRAELLNLLLQFDIRPAPGDKVNLVDFAAREISDVGMYQRVAKGTRCAY